MKPLQIIWLLLVSPSIYGQVEPGYIKLKPVSIEKRTYFAPNFISEAYHPIEGIGNLRNPTDSISSDRIYVTGMMEEELQNTLIAKSLLAENRFTILVDTSLVTLKNIELSPTFQLNKTYSSYPRSLRTIKNGKLQMKPLSRQTTLTVVAQPVFIANLSDDVNYLTGYSGQLSISQQALDKNGNWKDIETGITGGCSMTKYICELRKNDFVLTTVFRFQGSFKTLLRIRLETDSTTFFSEPFPGSISYEQLYNPKIREIEGALYERL